MTTEARHGRWYLLLVFGLLGLAIAGGVLTTIAASRHGFTPVAGAAPAPTGH